jgi:hypothetical protein
VNAPSLLIVASLLACLAACGGASGTAGSPAKGNRVARSAEPIELYVESVAPDDALSELRPVGMDDGPVPGFRVQAVDGQTLDSEQLVGNRPFVVMFYATWCQMCDLKMPHVRRALDALGPVTVIGVSLDDPDSWPKARVYLNEFGLRVPVVRASRYPRFAISYNPFEMVPLVVVVGRNGGLVDYQMGYAPNDRDRLIDAVKLARRIGPLADPHAQPQPEPPSGL